MAVPDKHDPLSASISEIHRVNGVECEVACYGSSNDYVCRITQQCTKPVASEMNDGYSPLPDGGMLWIRSFDDNCFITGFVQKHLFPDSSQLHDFLDTVQAMLTVDQSQPLVNIQALSKDEIHRLEFNGEQMRTTYK